MSTLDVETGTVVQLQLDGLRVEMLQYQIAPRWTRSAKKVSTVSHFLYGYCTIAVYTPFTHFHTTLFTLLLP